MHAAPNAALLIDFDNVTMGIRSDLGKELKALLNSDVIRGKVAVQRAYADWRRYPQYIVPLAESSIDLIFAPAYGSSKKNATDLRMAIDAMELVFTRPEIGTFILLTGDSDFSSCVLKLKEYGKYVIGVGMRESSSDLLIQNCDEYYSYHALSGLTRAGEVVESKEDPWVLVRTAVEQMVRERDVMRTDRLKQVMITLDHAFDEKKLGYSKFSKFVQEAEKKGLLQLRRGENGQQEIVPAGAAVAPAAEPTRAAPAAPAAEVEQERERERGRNGRHRRGGRGAPRGEAPREVAPQEATRPEPRPIAPTAEPSVEAAPEVAPAAEAPVEAAVPVPAAPAEALPAVAEPVAEVPAEAAPVAALQSAYALVQQALTALGGTARDAELKRRMLDISPAFDEGAFGFSKFTRFLRQAHDAEVVDLNRVGEGSYEVTLGSRRVSAPTAGAAAPEAKRGGRGRGGRGREARAAASVAPTEAPAAPVTEAAPAVEAPKVAEPVAETAPTPAPSVPVEEPKEAAAPVAKGRRGRGGRGAAGGPPPLLPGQIVRPPTERAPELEAPAAQPEAAAAAPAPAAPVAEAPKAEAPTAEAPTVEAAAPAAEPATPATPAEPAKRSVRGRRGGRGRGGAAAEAPVLLPGQVVSVESTPALPAAEPEAPAPAEAAAPAAEAPAPAEKPAPKKSRAPRGRGKRAAEAAVPAAEPEAPAAPRFDAAALGLPTAPEAMRTYLATAYKGVGQKTADTLMADFGEDAYRVLQEEPERVRTALGDRRAGQLLEHWAADYARRAEQPAAEQPQPAPEAAAEAAPEATAGGEAEAPRAKSRTRRGGRGRRKKPSTPAE